MIKSDKKYSTCNPKSVKDYSDWLTLIQSYSKKYQRFGSFLPAQNLLLKQIFASLTRWNEKVVSFTAPPASGKTHVIVLCAAYLARKGLATCVVTPTNELKSDFFKELADIVGGSKLHIPIVSISKYRKSKDQFDYALMDEAHNLRSSIEIDETIVKSFHLEEKDNLFELLTSGIESKKYVTKELNIETASDILTKMCTTENKSEAQSILRTLSQWRAFCVIFDKMCDLRFLLADPEKRNLLSKGRLFLFSATRLDEEELAFYCDIPTDALRTVGKKAITFVTKENVDYRYIPCVSISDKIHCAASLIEKFALPTLILLNNSSNCVIWKSELSKSCGDRIVFIPSRLKYTDRVKAFEKFAKGEDRILVTSSNVFWEGVTIRNLRLLIIPNVPFPQPTILELAKGRRPEYRKIADRRLIQGIGRIGRVPQNRGLCLLLFQPTDSFHYIRPSTMDETFSIISSLGTEISR
jgi:superfamily II DNA/RNA helicase